MKKLTTAILLITIITSTAFSIINIEFSGTYVRNNEQCSPGPGLTMNSIPTDIAIKQTSKQIEIRRTQKYGSGEIVTYTEVLNVDGTKSETKIDANTKRQSTIQYSPDKDALQKHPLILMETAKSPSRKQKPGVCRMAERSCRLRLMVSQAMIHIPGQAYLIKNNNRL